MRAHQDSSKDRKPSPRRGARFGSVVAAGLALASCSAEGDAELIVGPGSQPIPPQVPPISHVSADPLPPQVPPGQTRAVPTGFDYLGGDSNCDEHVTILDAYIASQAAVGLRTGAASCPLLAPRSQYHLANADVTGDGAVTVLDAYRISQCAVEIRRCAPITGTPTLTPQPPQPPPITPTPTTTPTPIPPQPAPGTE